ncbi:MAG TPA: GNAT family N-acetyltransferase [Candidatus Limnocylindria bacterium]|nr:GNAT family N-acetyltransferase [Candidatus Limnocylindria bacterium]
MAGPQHEFCLRLAREEDVPTLEGLVALCVRQSLARFYSQAQLDVALGPVFGVDRQLIRDGTYFVMERDADIVACGGWSKRLAVYGGDRERAGDDAELAPARDAARVRAFFVHPKWERRGIGRQLLEASEEAIRAAGFVRAELVATLAGEALYAAFGYEVGERYDAPMPGGLSLAVVRMKKQWPEA